jgi:lipopolysaccharide transport protein LptA
MRKWTRLHGISALAALLLIGAQAASAAGLLASAESGKAEGPTEILADRLVNHAAEKYAQFTGAVKATQGNFTITTDELRVYYEGDLFASQGGAAESRIIRIVAIGRVHVDSEQYNADADRLEYTPATEILVLTGESARVTSGQSFVSGAKITLNRRDGKAVAEGGPAARVKALLHPEDKEKGAGKKAGD